MDWLQCVTDFLRFILCCYVRDDDDLVLRRYDRLPASSWTHRSASAPSYTPTLPPPSPPPSKASPYASYSSSASVRASGVGQYSSACDPTAARSFLSPPLPSPAAARAAPASALGASVQSSGAGHSCTPCTYRSASSFATVINSTITSSSSSSRLLSSSTSQSPSPTVRKPALPVVLSSTMQKPPISSHSSSSSSSFSSPSLSQTAHKPGSAGVLSSSSPSPSSSSPSPSSSSSSFSSSPSPSSSTSPSPSPTVRKLVLPGDPSSSMWKRVSSSSSPVNYSPATMSVKTSSTHVDGSASALPPLFSRPFVSASRSPEAAESSASPKTSARQSPMAGRKDGLPTYEIPEQLKEMIKQDRVPMVLMGEVSKSNYEQYFAALLYAEDFYCEKWSEFLLENVTLKLRNKEDSNVQKSNMTSNKPKHANSSSQTEKYFVTFEIDAVPERRPFLLSRDHVFLRPVGQKVEPFQGFLVRVVKSVTILTEFGDDFFRQHSPSKKYDVSFSFNRVCLKRSHHAVAAAAAKDLALCRVLFPEPPRFGSRCRISDKGPKWHVNLAVECIVRLEGPALYLIEGPRVDTLHEGLTITGNMVTASVIRIHETSGHCRILICAPRNRTCDIVMSGLLESIPKQKLFRANAAFRDVDLVPDDIFLSSLFEGTCFGCPPVDELREFTVVTSTFISAFRLHSAGIRPGHFTHIFVLDASSATEPETVVALASLVGDETVVVVTGSCQDTPMNVRSDIGRRYGLRTSLFRRLHSLLDVKISNGVVFG